MNKELLDYFNGDELAASTWKNKYALKDKDGNPTEKVPTEMHWRMAKEFGRMEFKYRSTTEVNGARGLSEYGQKYWEETGELNESEITNRIFGLFDKFKYAIPQGSVMSALGAPFIASLSNCTVIESPLDSYGGIFKTDQELAQLMKRRCGVGVDMSELRPEGTATSNAALTTTGAVSFMHRFSNTTREVAQNGRRGALMLSMHVNHPDSLQFAQIKQDLSKVTGANISIKLTDEFMKAVEADEDYLLRFPVDIQMNVEDFQEGYEYNELYKLEGDLTMHVKKIKAKEHWEAIVKAARDVAEPGLLFWDNMTEYSPDGAYPQFRQVSTNPCSEIGMQANDTCRLIAINFFSFVKKPFTDEAEFDFDKLYEVNYESMRMSDNLVDLEIEHIDRILDKIKNDPEPDDIKYGEYNLWTKIRKSAEEGRRTGLGFTALGDTLAALGLKYDSDEALEMVRKIMRTKAKSELDASVDMAALRGSFTGWNPAREFNIVTDGKTDSIVEGTNPYYQFLLEEFPDLVERMVQHGRRNISISTVAPTGSLSMLAQTSSGIEPVFMLSYNRRRKVNPNSKNAEVKFVDDSGDSWEVFNVAHPKFKDWYVIAAQSEYVPHLALEALKNASIEDMNKIVAASPYAGATAPEIDWEKRVRLQGEVQKYTTHSISSTINLPEDVSEAEVDKIYRAAWKEGLKGITVYRDGSRSGVLVSNDKKEEETVTKFHDHHAPRRPKRLFAKLVRFNNNKERWIAFVGLLDGKPYEIFTGRLEDIKIPVKIETGEIVKVKDGDGKRRYDFEYEEGTLEGIDRVFSDDYWNYAKMISGTLRHGMPLHFVVDMVTNMSFPDDHINTWKNGVARTLKKFVPDGNAEGLKCYECGDVGNVVFEEGCMSCKSCGSSKCG